MQKGNRRCRAEAVPTTAAVRVALKHSLPGAVSDAWFDPFLDLRLVYPVAGTPYLAGHRQPHGQQSNRGEPPCAAKVFPKSEKEFPRSS